MAAKNMSRFCFVLVPAFAEALGFKEALSWVKSLNVQSVLFEMDALLVVQAIQHPIQDNSLFGTVIADCVCLLKEMPSCQVSFIPRSVNVVVHCLARASHSMPGLYEWGSVPPHFLFDVISDDSV